MKGGGGFSGVWNLIRGPGACTYSIHSLDVLRLILSYIYLICAFPFLIIGLVKGGGAPPFPPLGETLLTYARSAPKNVSHGTVSWLETRLDRQGTKH